MKYIAMKRNTDNILFNVRAVPILPSDAEQATEEAAMLSINGGTWEGVELTADQFMQAFAILRQGRRPKHVDNEIIGNAKMQISTDKASIQADDTDVVTITVNTGDAAYTGNITFIITTPESSGDLQSVVACVAGVATETITTEQLGTHTIRAESVEFGVVEIAFTGVE